MHSVFLQQVAMRSYFYRYLEAVILKYIEVYTYLEIYTKLFFLLVRVFLFRTVKTKLIIYKAYTGAKYK